MNSWCSRDRKILFPRWHAWIERSNERWELWGRERCWTGTEQHPRSRSGCFCFTSAQTAQLTLTWQERMMEELPVGGKQVDLDLWAATFVTLLCNLGWVSSPMKACCQDGLTSQKAPERSRSGRATCLIPFLTKMKLLVSVASSLATVQLYKTLRYFSVTFWILRIFEACNLPSKVL